MAKTQKTGVLSKVVRPGKIDGGYKSRRMVSVFCKIKWDGSKLSISGVIGPRRSGNAAGGCGQIDMEFAHRNPEDNDSRYSDPVGPDDIDWAPSWDAETWFDFLDIWKAYHLNDMQAGCEHQRGWDTRREVEIVTYQLTGETITEQARIEAKARKDLKADATATISQDEQAILTLAFQVTEAPDADGPGSGRYEVKRREKKALGWLRADEHADGLLCKPCEVCGYKYGSSWRHKDVPPDVIKFLHNLPETDVQPAWV